MNKKVFYFDESYGLDKTELRNIRELIGTDLIFDWSNLECSKWLKASPEERLGIVYRLLNKYGKLSDFQIDIEKVCDALNNIITVMFYFDRTTDGYILRLPEEIDVDTIDIGDYIDAMRAGLINNSDNASVFFDDDQEKIEVIMPDMANVDLLSRSGTNKEAKSTDSKGHTKKRFICADVLEEGARHKKKSGRSHKDKNKLLSEKYMQNNERMEELKNKAKKNMSRIRKI